MLVRPACYYDGETQVLLNSTMLNLPSLSSALQYFQGIFAWEGINKSTGKFRYALLLTKVFTANLNAKNPRELTWVSFSEAHHS